MKRRIVIIVVGICLVICLLAAILGGGGDGTKTSQPATTSSAVEPASTVEPTATSEPTATMTPVPTVPPFAEIEAQVEAMTEAQWKAYLQGLKGQRIENWTGWIVDVDKGLTGKYTAWIDMDEPGALSSQDVYCPVSEDVAMALMKGAKVIFSGTIERTSELLGSVSFTLGDDAHVSMAE
jgi:hypothetical protein